MPKGKKDKGKKPAKGGDPFRFMEADIRGWTLEKAFLFLLGLDWDTMIPPNASVAQMSQILRGRLQEISETDDPELPNNAIQLFKLHLLAKGVEADKASKATANFARQMPAPGSPDNATGVNIAQQTQAAVATSGSSSGGVPSNPSVTDYVDSPANNAVETFNDNWQDIQNAQGIAAKWTEVKDTARDLGTGIKTAWNNFWRA